MPNKAQQQISEFFSNSHSRTWPTGQIIIHAGDEPTSVYYIESGEIRQYSINSKGIETIVNVFHSQAFMPLSCVFGQQGNDYFYQTVGETTLRSAPKADVLDFIKSHPDVMYDLIERLYSGMDGVLSRMVHSMSNSAHIRILNELKIQTQRIHPSKTSQIELYLKEYELGMYCGLSPETVSRECKKLKEQGLIEVTRQGIVITDLTKLEQTLAAEL